MILGISLSTFTIVHVIISLIAIVAGLVVVAGMLGSQRMPGLTALFLVTTILTSATGFLFPINGFTPAHRASGSSRSSFWRSRCWRSTAGISPAHGAGFTW